MLQSSSPIIRYLLLSQQQRKKFIYIHTYTSFYLQHTFQRIQNNGLQVTGIKYSQTKFKGVVTRICISHFNLHFNGQADIRLPTLSPADGEKLNNIDVHMCCAKVLTYIHMYVHIPHIMHLPKVHINLLIRPPSTLCRQQH